MKDVLVLGAGKIGALISGLLAESGDYRVQLADSRANAAAEVVAAHGLENLRAFELDAADEESLTEHLRAHPAEALVSGLPYFCNPPVARVARAEGLHYFDLTEDVAVTETVRQLAQGSDKVFVPQCGLAPGFISIAANELLRHFNTVSSVKLRVGALPQAPNNVLKYSLTWSTDGVINEYGNLCKSIVNGNEVDVMPLEGLEEIEIDGSLYEAFNTSGGLGSLGETYRGQVANMDYKTIRYPGHCKHMRLLMNGLGLNQDRDTLKRILENSIPQTLQDVVIIYAAVTGYQDGEFREAVKRGVTSFKFFTAYGSSGRRTHPAAMRRAFALIEELEAVDWYQQRADGCSDPDLKAILIHNMEEEIEHAVMVMEWLRRNSEPFAREMKERLFTDDPIVDHH